MADKDVKGKGGAGSSMQLILALVIISLIAAGAGGLAGLKLTPQVAAPLPVAASANAASAQADGKDKGQAATTVAVVDVPAVITNLKSPADVWVRLETSMVVERKPDQLSPDVISGQLASDFLAYMRTLSLADIQSPDGLQNLRSDLDDRATARSKGLVKEILIRTLVVQ